MILDWRRPIRPSAVRVLFDQLILYGIVCSDKVCIDVIHLQATCSRATDCINHFGKVKGWFFLISVGDILCRCTVIFIIYCYLIYLRTRSCPRIFDLEGIGMYLRGSCLVLEDFTYIIIMNTIHDEVVAPIDRIELTSLYGNGEFLF